VEEPIFDIFSGTPNENPAWLEAVRGSSNATERIEQIAAQKPRAYFMFSVESHKVFAQIDTAKHLQLKKAVAF
jgi:hypothetical protein